MKYRSIAFKVIMDWSKENLDMNKSLFYSSFLPLELSNQAKSIVDSCQIKGKRIKDYFMEGKFDNAIRLQLDDFVRFQLKSSLKSNFLNLLLDTLLKIDKEHAERLHNYLRVQHIRITNKYISVSLLSNTLYQYFMFIMCDEVPAKAFLEGYSDHAEDRNEFVVKVLEPNGANCPNGHFLIYRLAEKGNVYALMEAGDIAYHGYNVLGKVDFQEAFDYYNKSVELGKIHPPIIFTMACMYLNYQDPNYEYKDAYIRQIDNLSLDERLDKAFEYIRLGLAWNDGKSYNILGLIYMDKRWPDWVRKHYFSESENAEYFFKKSIEVGCVYGHINYADYILEQVQKNCNCWSAQKVEEHYQLYIDHSIKASEMGSSIALVNMAKLYHNGASYNGKVFVEKDAAKVYEMLILATKSAHKYLDTYFEAMQMLIEYYYLNINSSHYMSVSPGSMLQDIEKIMEYDFDNDLKEKFITLKEMLGYHIADENVMVKS